MPVDILRVSLQQQLKFSRAIEESCSVGCLDGAVIDPRKKEGVKKPFKL